METDQPERASVRFQRYEKLVALWVSKPGAIARRLISPMYDPKIKRLVCVLSIVLVLIETSSNGKGHGGHHHQGGEEPEEFF
jgi:hypothetical protein